MRPANLEGKPKEQIKQRMLVDAELEDGEEQEEAAVLEKKTMNRVKKYNKKMTWCKHLLLPIIKYIACQ